MPPKLILTQQQETEISNFYSAGLSAFAVSQKVGLTEKIVTSRLKQWGIRRNWRQAKSKYEFNENVFSIITPKTFYWVGFIMADGNVWHSKNRQARTSVALHIKDREHLVKLSDFLSMDRDGIYDYANIKQSKLTVSSNRIAADLAKFGVIPKKSMIAEIPCERIDVLYSHDFWRGVTDGDGCIRTAKYKYPSLTLTSGSSKFLDQFENYLKHYGFPLGNIVSNITYAINGRKCLPVIHAMYTNSSVYLSRKHNKAMEILQNE